MEITSVQKRIALIEKLEAENKINKELLKAELENDPHYLQAHEEAKATAMKKKNLKEEILNQPANAEIAEKIKDNQEEIATNKDILNAELLDHYRKHNTDEVTDASGSLRKFKVVIKLLPRQNPDSD